MKSKLLFLGTALLAIVAAVGFSLLDTDFQSRYQQHLEEPGPEAAQAAAEEDGAFHSHLPLLLLDTGGAAIPGMARDGSTVTAQVAVVDGGQGNNTPSDAPALNVQAQIRYRGNSSLYFDKKSYRLKLTDAAGESLSQEMLGMAAEDEWILHGPFLDKSLLRNYMLMNLSGQVMSHTPEVRFCEMFLNGEYQGLYVLMQSVSRSLLNLDKASEREAVPYLIRLDRGGNLNLNVFSQYTLRTQNQFNVVYPPASSCTPEQAEYIEEDFSQFEKALYSLDYADPQLGYRAYLDVDSFVDYMILNEFFQNYDATRYSTYFYRPLGGRISIGPVWDFNNALDNYIETPMTGEGFLFPSSTWFNMLCRDEWFVDRVVRRYWELRDSVLSEDYLLEYVDNVTAWLEPAANRNFQVWGYAFEWENGLLQPANRNLENYQDALDQVKDFLIRRGDWLDQNIELLYQYCHPSANKRYNH